VARTGTARIPRRVGGGLRDDVSVRTLVIAAVLVSSATRADPNAHSSVTFDGELGAAYTFTACADQTGCPSDPGLSLAIGGGAGQWLTHSTSIELRTAAVVFRDLSRTEISGFVGPELHQWLGTHAWVSAGPGVGFFSGPHTVASFSLDARAGLVVATYGKQAVSIAVEAAPLFKGGDRLTPVMLVVAVQHR